MAARAREGTPRPPNSGRLAMRHRRECGRHIGVAQVHVGGPDEAALAPHEVDDEGKHDSHPCLNCALHK